MAAQNLPTSTAKTITLESWVYTDAPDDPGGPTKGGIDLATLQGWRGPNEVVTAADVEQLSMAEATAIYAARFWQAVSADLLPGGVDFMVFDMDVTSGSNSGRILQRLVGLSGADVDGWIGPQTVEAVSTFPATRALPALTKTAVTLVQTRLGLNPDGLVGPQTRAALQGHDTLVLCAALYSRQAVFYASAKPAEYRDGWLNRARDRFDFALTLL